MKKLMFVVLMIAAVSANAQKVVEDFTLKNVVDGHDLSLSTYPACSGLVMIFTSNSCPYDDYYKNRIQKIAKEYSDKVPVILVNSLIDANETPEQMMKKAQQSGLTVPYLADKDQLLLQRLGASKTPHAVLLKNNGGKFTVFYSGALDDNAQVENDVHQHYLNDAIQALLGGKAPVAENRPVGCTIRKK
jgi:thioredoxin-related protein